MANFKLFTDGGVAGANPSPIGGAAAFVLTDEGDAVIQRRVFRLVPGECVYLAAGVWPEQITNNNAELAAICYGLMVAKSHIGDGDALTVYSDSAIALGWVFSGFKLDTVPGPLRYLLARAQAARQGGGWVGYELLAGHPTRKDLAQGFRVKNGTSYPVHARNVECDRLCTEACRALIEAAQGEINA